MAKNTANHCKAWTRSEVMQLRQLLKEKTPPAEIAERMGRTKGGIRDKTRQDRISMTPPNKSPYGPG